MITLIEKYLEATFMAAVIAAYPDVEQWKRLSFQVTSNSRFGDFQTNFAMQVAPDLKLPSRDIAQSIIANLEQSEAIEKVDIAGPGFINVFLAKTFVEAELMKSGVEPFDFSFLDRDGDVIVDYSSPNIAKPMHIGHLGSTVIGDAIKRIYSFLGYHTIGDNHLGDWGTQFGKLIVAYDRWLDKEAFDQSPIDELERIYVKFAQESERDESLDDLARQELVKLQNGDPRNIALWKEFVRVSLAEYALTYDVLGIKFDSYKGESFYHEMNEETLAILRELNIIENSDGAQVVFFDETDNLHPLIVRKKDGGFNYATSDLSSVRYKLENHHVNRVIYVTDDRQQAHFKQFFKVAEMAGWTIRLEHVFFGLKRFADGVFSTRKGNVIKLADLIDEAVKKSRALVEEKNPGLPEEEKETISKIVGIGAIKYSDLCQNRSSTMIFDWDKVLSFEGNTSLYLQYTFARIQSIKRKADKPVTSECAVSLKREEERALACMVLQFPSVVVKAAETYKPNVLSDYLFGLCQAFNSFYTAVPILKEPDAATVSSRIILCDKVGRVINAGLDLFGIQTVDRL